MKFRKVELRITFRQLLTLHFVPVQQGKMGNVDDAAPRMAICFGKGIELLQVVIVQLKDLLDQAARYFVRAFFHVYVGRRIPVLLNKAQSLSYRPRTRFEYRQKQR